MAINTVEVYSSARVVQTFPLSESGIDADLFQILNVDGLDPVKATVNTSNLAAVDGVAIVGTDIPARDIVLTIRLNPDWATRSYEALRQALYAYFTPKNTIRMIFGTDELSDIEITGIVESVEANPFTKDPQFLVSIVCQDPYFTKVDATVVTGNIVALGSWPPTTDPIVVGGHVPIGFQLKLTHAVYNFYEFVIQSGDPSISTFHIVSSDADLAAVSYFKMDSRPRQKSVRAIDSTSGAFVSVLPSVQAGSVWPTLEPGDNLFAVLGSEVGEPWELTYFEKYSGL